MEQSLWGLIYHSVSISGGVEKAVLLILVVMSIISWALILLKVRLVRRVREENALFRTMFDQAEHTGHVIEQGAQYQHAIKYAIFKSGLDMLNGERAAAATQRPAPGDGHLLLKTTQALEEKVQQSMQHASKRESARMYRGLDILASIGSSSPFIGLLGTVWGIMATFQTLSGAKSASLAVVAPGIASALIATAAGLAVAIPAVIAYNWIMARLDEIQEQVNCFIERACLLLQASGGLSQADSTKKPAGNERH